MIYFALFFVLWAAYRIGVVVGYRRMGDGVREVIREFQEKP